MPGRGLGRGYGRGYGRGRGNGRGRGFHHHHYNEHHHHHYEHNGKDEEMEEEGMGPVGNCICIKCGFKKPHTSGIPCMEEKCPKCGTKMFREGSYHHQEFLKRRGEKK
jgi:hypothetical protein